jgi:ribosomal small subunit protein bTHX
MGKGDRKSKKGKIWRDSYGNSRMKKSLKAKLKRNASKKSVATVESEAVAKPKRVAAKKKTDS